jgi:hypothetical protein
VETRTRSANPLSEFTSASNTGARLSLFASRKSSKRFPNVIGLGIEKPSLHIPRCQGELEPMPLSAYTFSKGDEIRHLIWISRSTFISVRDDNSMNETVEGLAPEGRSRRFR